MVSTTSAVMWAVGLVMVAMLVMGQSPRRRRDDEDIPECDLGGVYMRSNQPCPPRAVCADVWDTVRDWYNGTRCRDFRVMFNCMCPGNTMCPIDNPDHVLYSNRKQAQVMCDPVCNLEACRTMRRPAKEMVTNITDRNNKYYRMNCRCADHHVPLSGRRGYLSRATVYSRIDINRNTGQILTQYKCNRLLPEGRDPCPPRSPRLD